MCTTNTKKGANEGSILFTQQKFKTSTRTAVVNEDVCFSSCSLTGKNAKGNNQIKQNNATKKKKKKKVIIIPTTVSALNYFSKSAIAFDLDILKT